MARQGYLNRFDAMPHNPPIAWRHRCSILRCVDTAAAKPGDLVSPTEQPSASPHPAPRFSELPASLLKELWTTSEAETCGLTLEEFSAILGSVGTKLNHGIPAGVVPDTAQEAAFFRSLHLSELALAHACALGKEVAWERFLQLYRAFLVQVAVAITGSVDLGQELADSLYAELYGLRQLDGERRSPFASYSGRGSLRGWLRTTIAQRFRDHYRRTRHETQLEDIDCPAPESFSPILAEQTILAHAIARTLQGVAAEDRYLLAAYYLDRQTQLQIARILNVHEATISRRLSRLVADLRKQLLGNLFRGGLSKRAAEEALGTDPRDLEINIRRLMQSSQIASFSDKTAPTAASHPL